MKECEHKFKCSAIRTEKWDSNDGPYGRTVTEDKIVIYCEKCGKRAEQ